MYYWTKNDTIEPDLIKSSKYTKRYTKKIIVDK